MEDVRVPSWYALYTKSRHEKSIKYELERRNIESFLPTRKIRRRWSDRSVTIEEPLFKSYLFVKINPFHRYQVLTAKGAVALVGAKGRPISIEEDIINSLKNITREGLAADPFPYLEKGERVYIKSGPFKGIEGYISRKDARRCRLVISIEAIKSSISIEADSYLVEKI